MKPRVIFIHGNDTLHWSSSWAGWLQHSLDVAGYENFFETFPDSINARAKYWLEFLEAHIHASENDVIVGWSSGAVAALKYAEQHRILGSVLVSPSLTDLGDPVEKESGWYDNPWDWETIKNNQKQIGLFYGTDDPYIPQEQFIEVEKKLEPTSHPLTGRKHFIGESEFPELLNYIFTNYK